MTAILDFAMLPPEVNSARMYSGSGSGPMLAAASAWKGMAAELRSTALSYGTVLSGLTDEEWQGPASASMAAAAAPYVAWMETTAVQAEQTAAQAEAAAAAYEAAFKATVPPALIAANRTQLMSLVARNILGQNTAPIAATEAQYAEMWAQDAAAMYGYAGASAAATTVTPFNPPPPTTNPAGAGTQAAAVAQAAASPAGAAQNVLSGVPNSLQSLATGANLGVANLLDNPWINDFESINSALSGYTGFISGSLTGVAGILFTLNPFVITGIGKGMEGAALPAAAAAAAVPKAAVGALSGSLGGGGGVSAGLGGAATVGALSVPQSWATASPAIRLAATALPAAGLAGLPEVGAAGLGGFGGMPPMLGAVNAPRNGASGPRSESRVKVIPQMAGVDGATPGRSANAPRGNAPLSEREELHGLRQAIADLAKERDMLISSAARMLKEATS